MGQREPGRWRPWRVSRPQREIPRPPSRLLTDRRDKGMKKGRGTKRPGPFFWYFLPRYLAAVACSMVCEHVTVSEGVTVSSLPEKPMSSAVDLYWTTPCSLATLPVLPVC